MAIFAIIAPAENQALSEAVAREFKDRFYRIAPGQFLVSAVFLAVASGLWWLGTALWPLRHQLASIITGAA